MLEGLTRHERLLLTVRAAVIVAFVRVNVVAYKAQEGKHASKQAHSICVRHLPPEESKQIHPDRL